MTSSIEYNLTVIWWRIRMSTYCRDCPRSCSSAGLCGECRWWWGRRCWADTYVDKVWGRGHLCHGVSREPFRTWDGPTNPWRMWLLPEPLKRWNKFLNFKYSLDLQNFPQFLDKTSSVCLQGGPNIPENKKLITFSKI